MEDKTAEATDSLSKDTGGIVGLDRPLDSLDLTNILAKEFEEKEQESEEPSPSGGVVEEAEPVGEIEPTEEPAEEATNTEHDLSQNESERESEPVAELGEEPEWMQRRIDRFTRKLHLAEEERDELGKRGIVMPIMFRRKGDYCSRLSLLNLFEIKLRKKTPTKPHEIMIEKHKNGDVDGPATNNIPRLSILKKSPES